MRRAHITYIHAMLSFVLGFMVKRAHTSSIFDYFLDDTKKSLSLTHPDENFTCLCEIVRRSIIAYQAIFSTHLKGIYDMLLY